MFTKMMFLLFCSFCCSSVPKYKFACIKLSTFVDSQFITVFILGTFGNRTGLKNESECLPCSAGYWCSPNTELPTQKCSEGYWCIGGSFEPTPVDKPYGTDCPNGSYCPEGTPLPIKCSKGTYNPYRGKKNQGDCLPCDPGKYCETTGLISATGPCDPGYFCLTKASRSNPTDGTTGNVCPMGHFCEGGSPKPVPCQNGTYMNSTGMCHFLK